MEDNLLYTECIEKIQNYYKALPKKNKAVFWSDITELTHTSRITLYNKIFRPGKYTGNPILKVWHLVTILKYIKDYGNTTDNTNTNTNDDTVYHYLKEAENVPQPAKGINSEDFPTNQEGYKEPAI